MRSGRHNGGCHTSFLLVKWFVKPYSIYRVFRVIRVRYIKFLTFDI